MTPSLKLTAFLAYEAMGRTVRFREGNQISWLISWIRSVIFYITELCAESGIPLDPSHFSHLLILSHRFHVWCIYLPLACLSMLNRRGKYTSHTHPIGYIKPAKQVDPPALAFTILQCSQFSTNPLSCIHCCKCFLCGVSGEEKP